MGATRNPAITKAKGKITLKEVKRRAATRGVISNEGLFFKPSIFKKLIANSRIKAIRRSSYADIPQIGGFQPIEPSITLKMKAPETLILVLTLFRFLAYCKNHP